MPISALLVPDARSSIPDLPTMEAIPEIAGRSNVKPVIRARSLTWAVQDNVGASNVFPSPLEDDAGYSSRYNFDNFGDDDVQQSSSMCRKLVAHSVTAYAM